MSDTNKGEKIIKTKSFLKNVKFLLNSKGKVVNNFALNNLTPEPTPESTPEPTVSYTPKQPKIRTKIFKPKVSSFKLNKDFEN